MTRHRAIRAVATPSEARARRRRLTTIGAAIVLAAGLTAMSHQYVKTYTLAREKARLEQRRRDLIADNARLRDEIERLQTDDRYIEEIARRQLGLVRPGEIELLVVPSDGTGSAPGDGPAGTRVDGGPGRAIPGAGTPLPADSPQPTVSSNAARPHRGIGAWAAAVRDAILRLLGAPRR